MGQLLNRAAILAAPDLKYEEVPVPEWGGTVRVRGMTGSERDAWELRCARSRETPSPDDHIRASLVAYTIVDENGNRLFSDEDIAALGAKSAAAVTRVYDVASRLSRVTKGDIEELKGNSDAGPSAASTSTSPANAG